MVCRTVCAVRGALPASASRLRSLQQLLQLESSAFWSMAGAGISVNVIATGVTLIDQLVGWLTG
jgi:hypothetical protein